MGNQPVPTPNQNKINGLFPNGNNRPGAGGGPATPSTGPNTPEAIKLRQQGFVWVPSIGAFVNPTTEEVVRPAAGVDPTTGVTGPDSFLTNANTNSNTSTDLQENSSQNTDIRERQRAQENRYDNTYENSVTNSRDRRYVDIPTAEEILDDFETGLAMHFDGLRKSGSVSTMAINWLMENQSRQFLSSYLGKLGTMAKSGVPIFKVVGAGGNPTYLGSRQGNTSSAQTTGYNTRTGAADTTSSGYQSSSGSESTNRNTQSRSKQNSTAMKTPQYNGQVQSQQGGGTGSGSVTLNPSGGHLPNGSGHLGGYDPNQDEDDDYYNTPGQNANTNNNQTQSNIYNTNKYNTVNSSGERNTSTNEVVDSKGNRLNNVTEDIFSRPKLGTVRTLSPSDFLSQTYSAADLNLLYEGQKGMRFREGRAAGPTSARRM